MAYQPNPFVNPEQRGVGLPPGYKDLIDVLKQEAKGEFYDGFTLPSFALVTLPSFAA